jgi:hypothetical protein
MVGPHILGCERARFAARSHPKCGHLHGKLSENQYKRTVKKVF